MKKFTLLKENTTDNPGNDLLKTGVTNHYMPIETILVNINNLYCCRLGIEAEKGEDNVSIRLSSSKFTNKDTTMDLLGFHLEDFNTPTLYDYLYNCGLTKYTCVNLGGGYCVAYFSPEDIKTAENPVDMEENPACTCDDCCPCPCEAKESLLSEFELSSIIKEDDDEEEMKSATVEKVLELLDGPDKVKAAKQLELLVMNEIQLPREFYFAAIKFKSGEEAIALRWKYTKKMPFGKVEGEEGYKETTVENTRSIMHIFGKGDQAIWVQDYDKESIVQLPDDVKKLIDNILELLEAGKTDNPSIFKLTGERQERDNKDDKKEDDEDKKDDKKEASDSNDKKDDEKSDNESEDDDSRGDSSDNLL